ncbi:hypothetical protein C1C98_12490 [Pseudomonas ogarae]|uniref:DUF1534 domain-containing protein n=1 Tax=Pseudomonas ogarae (strain DSM 112162 / CECT 30235 / F113) TaxID=1114970 RepID=A0ABM6QYZ6_PSEO1|nr:hypothetical protein C1C98_12490 [Pseudomonas ogarae]
MAASADRAVGVTHPPLNPVGASLLAIAPAHPASMQADPPLSRASSLPQGIGLWRCYSGHHPPRRHRGSDACQSPQPHCLSRLPVRHGRHSAQFHRRR